MLQEMGFEEAGTIIGGEPWVSGLNGDPYARQAAANSRGYGGDNLKYTTPVAGNSPISFSCGVALTAAVAATGKTAAEAKQGNPNAGWTGLAAVATWGNVLKQCP